MPDRPNILLLLTDQQRYDTLGANGATVCRTPHIDALAVRGVNFDSAYTCISLCTPARASLFTGRLPHKHGLVRNTDVLAEAARQIPTTIPTIAERLNDVGYRCALEGKWHAGDRSASQCGFEGLDVPGYGDATKTEAYEQHLKKHGLERPELTPMGSGWTHNYVLCGRMTGDVKASVPYFLAERTIDQLRSSAESDQPFFISTCFWGPHAPYVPCEPYASMYDPATIEPWGNFEDSFDNKPEIYRRYRDSFIGRDGQLRTWEQCAQWAALYFGFTTQIDEQCGRILAALDEFGLAENTIVMFATDHGDLCGAHGGMHDKTSIMVQELFHIPLVVQSPFGNLSGERCAAPVSSIDLSATICVAAGCDAPELDGRSLLPLLDEQAPPDDWPDHVVAMDFGIHFNHDTRMIVSGRMKYIFRPSDIDELYDLEADPWEMQNLIDDPAFQQAADTMRDKLIAWCAANDDPLLPVLRNFYSDRSACTIENAQPYRKQTHQL